MFIDCNWCYKSMVNDNALISIILVIIWYLYPIDINIDQYQLSIFQLPVQGLLRWLKVGGNSDYSYHPYWEKWNKRSVVLRVGIKRNVHIVYSFSCARDIFSAFYSADI